MKRDSVPLVYRHDEKNPETRLRYTTFLPVLAETSNEVKKEKEKKSGFVPLVFL